MSFTNEDLMGLLSQATLPEGWTLDGLKLRKGGEVIGFARPRTGTWGNALATRVVADNYRVRRLWRALKLVDGSWGITLPVLQDLVDKIVASVEQAITAENLSRASYDKAKARRESALNIIEKGKSLPKGVEYAGVGKYSRNMGCLTLAIQRSPEDMAAVVELLRSLDAKAAQ